MISFRAVSRREVFHLRCNSNTFNEPNGGCFRSLFPAAEQLLLFINLWILLRFIFKVFIVVDILSFY
jgi:hypothetical protein